MSRGQIMNTMQTLCDLLLRELESGFRGYSGGGSKEWTKIRTKAGLTVAREFAKRLGRKIDLPDTELPVEANGKGYRLDIYAKEAHRTDEKLFFAMETELAHWGYRGSSGKD
jgi:hypothetical protein